MICFQYLETGRPLGDLDEYSKLSSENARKNIKRFSSDIVQLYASQYRNTYPNKEELQNIGDRCESLAFLRCIGAFDCCNILQKICPLTRKGSIIIQKTRSWQLLRSRRGVMKTATLGTG